MYFAQTGIVAGKVYRDAALTPGTAIWGPAIIESPATSIVVTPGVHAMREASGSILLTLSS